MAGAIPRDFFPAVQTLAEFSRNKVRVNTQGATSVGPGDVTIFTLPEGKLFLPTFSIGGLLTTETSTGVTMCRSVYDLIESYTVEFGGISVTPGMTFYNHLHKLHSDFQGAWNKAPLRKILQLQATDGAATAANQSAVPFQINHWLGPLGSWKILPTDRTPVCRVYIKWASPAVLAGAPILPVNPRYRIDGLYATVDMLSLSPVYDQLLTDKLSKSPLSLPYTNYTCVPCATSPVGAIEARWSTSANSLERVMGTMLPVTYQAADKSVDAVTFGSTYFNKGVPLDDADPLPQLESTFEVNAVRYPNVGMRLERGEILQSTLEALNENQDITSRPHPNLDSLRRFASKWFLHAHSFTYDDDASDGRLCGLSGMGQNLLGGWHVVGTANQLVVPLIILQHKSVLEIGAGRNIRYVH